MTKELFIATINSIKKQIEIDRKNSSMLQEMFPDDIIYCGDNSELFNALNKILKESMKDEYDWIDYFIYELDFGEKYRNGMVKESDGSIIDLSNVERLYEFLIKTYSK